MPGMEEKTVLRAGPVPKGPGLRGADCNRELPRIFRDRPKSPEGPRAEASELGETGRRSSISVLSTN
jgi:hypothetical protein